MTSSGDRAGGTGRARASSRTLQHTGASWRQSTECEQRPPASFRGARSGPMPRSGRSRSTSSKSRVGRRFRSLRRTSGRGCSATAGPPTPGGSRLRAVRCALSSVRILARSPADLRFEHDSARFAAAATGSPRVASADIEFQHEPLRCHRPRRGCAPRAFGVDVESVPSEADAEELSRAFLSSAERASLLRLAPGRRIGAALLCLVRKEAVLKAADEASLSIRGRFR